MYILRLIIMIMAISPVYASMYSVTFHVKAPKGTKDLFIVGSSKELGNWDPGTIKLKKKNDLFVLKLTLPSGDYEYKYTEGSWKTVEKGESLEEISNRKLHISKNTLIKDEVINFANSEIQAHSHTLTGNIEYINTLKYKIIVYLPPDYKKSNKKYSVLYMQDGQNIFDDATSFLGIEWNADETAEKLIKEKKIEPIIIVGIYNTSKRADDYTPFYDKTRKTGGKANKYLEFIISKLIPFINKKYRTISDKDHTAIAGSSLGGLFSVYASFQRPDIFGKAAIISPSIWWDNKKIISFVNKKGPSKVWLDIGDQEGDPANIAINNTKEFRDRLISLGYKDDSLKYFEAKDSPHNEAAWSKRFDKVLLFLFGK